jgi:hypothetical protein
MIMKSGASMSQTGIQLRTGIIRGGFSAVDRCEDQRAAEAAVAIVMACPAPANSKRPTWFRPISAASAKTAN